MTKTDEFLRINLRIDTLSKRLKEMEDKQPGGKIVCDHLIGFQKDSNELRTRTYGLRFMSDPLMCVKYQKSCYLHTSFLSMEWFDYCPKCGEDIKYFRE